LLDVPLASFAELLDVPLASFAELLDVPLASFAELLDVPLASFAELSEGRFTLYPCSNIVHVFERAGEVFAASLPARIGHSRVWFGSVTERAGAVAPGLSRPADEVGVAGRRGKASPLAPHERANRVTG
jgi:hypothetical protein